MTDSSGRVLSSDGIASSTRWPSWRDIGERAGRLRLHDERARQLKQRARRARLEDADLGASTSTAISVPSAAVKNSSLPSPRQRARPSVPLLETIHFRRDGRGAGGTRARRERLHESSWRPLSSEM